MRWAWIHGDTSLHIQSSQLKLPPSKTSKYHHLLSCFPYIKRSGLFSLHDHLDPAAEMSTSYHPASHLIDPVRPLPRPRPRSHLRAPAFLCNSRTGARAPSPSGAGDVLPPQRSEKARRVQRAPRRLITISTSDGRWHGQWSCDYAFSLGELDLADIAEQGQTNAEVLVSLSIQKHAGFGFSVEGRVTTSFTCQCSSCFSSYAKEINSTFDVWVLPSSRNNPLELPEMGGNDPSVIYVKPGSEAHLDSLIRDTIRLAASAKDTCSESCEKSTPRWNYIDGKSTYDRRWYRLVEIRDAYKDVLPG